MKKLAYTAWLLLQNGSTAIVIIGVGLLIRLSALFLLADLPLESDALSYHKMALTLLSQNDFSPYWPPALPSFLAFAYLIFGAVEFVGRASMLLFYLLFSLGLVLLTREFSSLRIANIALLIFSIFPTFIFHSVEPLTQLPTAAFLLMAAYLMVLIIKKPNWAYPVGLGVTMGMLVLLRASNLILAGMIPVYLFLRIKNLRSALIPLVVSLLIVFSWIYHVNNMTGQWIMVNRANSFNFFIGNNTYTPLYKTWWFGSHGEGDVDVPAAYTAMLSEIKRGAPDSQDRQYLQIGLNHIFSRPDLFFIRTVNRIRNYFAFDTFTGSALIVGYGANKYLGLVIIFLDALFYCTIMMVAFRYFFSAKINSYPLEKTLLPIFLTITYALPYWISFSHPTYHFPVVPLFGILALAFVEKGLEHGEKYFVWSWLPPGSKKYLFLFGCLVFILTQLEWVIVMWSRV